MQAKDLIHKNPIYNAIYEQMLAYQYAYLGGYIFKTYVRKKRPSEDSNLYLDLVQNTVAQPILLILLMMYCLSQVSSVN